MSLETSLRDHFGLATFRSGQRKAIETLLSGHDALVVMPTGTGKSLIYQMAALHRPGVTLVISPLIALMKDQVDQLTQRGIPAAHLSSGISQGDRQATLQRLAAGQIKLLYVAPERLRHIAFRQALRHVQVSLLAIDEAHCVSHWGHDFRPAYLRIGAFRQQLGATPTVALTATATPRVQDDIAQQLGIPNAQRIVTGFNRPNLYFNVRMTPQPAAKLSAIETLLRNDLEGGAAIIYAGTRRGTVEIAQFIQEVVGLPAEAYHGNRDWRDRRRVQEAFAVGELPIVAATNAFGMGIDRADVRLVIHHDMPGSLEAYYQEAGRAGRDGAPAQAALLYDPQDRALQEWFISHSVPDLEQCRQLYGLLEQGPQQFWTSLRELCLATSIRQTSIRLALAQLEQAKALTALGIRGQEMLLRIDRWDEAAMAQITELAAKHQVQRTKQLQQMVAYAESAGCRRRKILEHFGDQDTQPVERCCDNCSRQARAAPVRKSALPADMEAIRVGLLLLDAIKQAPRPLGRTRLGEILKGSLSKGVTRYGYHRHIHHGKLGQFRHKEILALYDQLIERGFVRKTPGFRPVLELSERGEQALRARETIPLTLPAGRSSGSLPKPQPKAGDTYRETAELFRQGLDAPAIAQRRGLQASTIYGHLARLVADGQIAVEAVLDNQTILRIEQAIAQAHSERLAEIKQYLPSTIDYGHIKVVLGDHACKRVAGKTRRPATPAGPAHDASVEAFLAHSHPVELDGPWDAGWALGHHSRFFGNAWQRSEIGELAFRLKYREDQQALKPLVKKLAAFCRAHDELSAVDRLLPVPSTARRTTQPVLQLARGLSHALGLPLDASLIKVRSTNAQKSLETLVQKQRNVQGAFAYRGDLRGKRVLVLDDLHDSGATLVEITRVLRARGARHIAVLTLTATIHQDD